MSLELEKRVQSKDRVISWDDYFWVYNTIK